VQSTNGGEPSCAGAIYAAPPQPAVSGPSLFEDISTPSDVRDESVHHPAPGINAAMHAELVARQHEVEVIRQRLAQSENLLALYQTRDDKKQQELSKQLSMNRVHNEEALAALRQRVTHCEDDLDTLYADPEGVREDARQLLTTTDQASVDLQGLLEQLEERRKQVESLEVSVHAQQHRLAANALVELCSLMRDALEGRTQRMPAPGRVQQLESQLRSCLRLARERAIEVGVDPGADAAKVVQRESFGKETQPRAPAGTARVERQAGSREPPATDASPTIETVQDELRARDGASTAHKTKPTRAQGLASRSSHAQETSVTLATAKMAFVAGPEVKAPMSDVSSDVAAGVPLEVRLEKPERDARLGVTLTGNGHPILEWVATDAIAHGKLRVGDRVLSVNGWNAIGHAETTKRLKRLYGTIRLKVMRPA